MSRDREPRNTSHNIDVCLRETSLQLEERDVKKAQLRHHEKLDFAGTQVLRLVFSRFSLCSKLFEFC